MQQRRTLVLRVRLCPFIGKKVAPLWVLYTSMGALLYLYGYKTIAPWEFSLSALLLIVIIFFIIVILFFGVNSIAPCAPSSPPLKAANPRAFTNWLVTYRTYLVPYSVVCGPLRTWGNALALRRSIRSAIIISVGLREVLPNDCNSKKSEALDSAGYLLLPAYPPPLFHSILICNNLG